MNRIQLHRFRLITASVVLLVALVAGCKRVIAPQAPPPPTVSVSQPLQREVIRWEADQHVPFDPENVELDFQILDPEGDGLQMQVLLVAAKRELVESKLTLLAERGQGHALMNELARLRLAQDEDRVAFLYLDGHVREYSGKEPLAKTKKAQRSVATCAATDTWLHDADGAPLLVVTSEMNAGLTQVLEPIVREAKALLPVGRRLTVLFDRGGWSVRLFARLSALGAAEGLTVPAPLR